MRDIQVVMSTYNGERYIESQIDTILGQKDVEVFLAIRDDGSSDQTLNILEKYKDNKNVEIYAGDNLGYAKSFLWLLNKYKNKAKYFAFSDQDDYWLEDKLAAAIRTIKSKQEENSSLYFSNLIATDEHLNPIVMKKFDKRSYSLGSSLSRPNIAGCTMVFNQKLALQVCKIPISEIGNRGHDSWVQNVCLATNGYVYYDSNSYILFRRHEGTTSIMNKNIVVKIKNEFHKIKSTPNLAYLQASILKKYLNDIIPLEKNVIIEDIINYQDSFYNKIKLLTNPNIKTGNKLVNIYLNAKIIINNY